jgi:hypothetical protein
MDLKTALYELYLEGKQLYNIQNEPGVELHTDEGNAKNIFGRTAYYDPQNQLIVLYVSGRHPKDILRSFAHELIHHIQNERGDLDMSTVGNDPQYAQNNTHLRKMEMEAYLKGNMMFRDWEDKTKNK